MTRTTTTTRTTRTTTDDAAAPVVTFTRPSRRGQYVVVVTGAPDDVTAAMGDVPACTAVRDTTADDGARTVAVRIGANAAARIVGTFGDGAVGAAVARGADDAGYAPWHVPTDDAAAVARFIGAAVRTFAERAAVGYGIANGAVDMPAVGLAAGDADVAAAMANRAMIARRPTTHRAAIVAAARDAAAARGADA